MRSVLIASLVASATAAPWGGWGFDGWGYSWSGKHMPRTTSNCMSDNDAQTVANNFKTLIASYSDSFANQTLTTDFVDYSDSVGELINGGCTTGGMATLGAPTFDSRANFEIGQGGQPAIPFEILNIWNNCNTVTLRWRTALTPQFVTGIIVLEVEKNANKRAAQKWLIKTVYSEFNSGAWLVDLGVFTPPQCPPPPPPTAGSSNTTSNGTASSTKLRRYLM